MWLHPWIVGWSVSLLFGFVAADGLAKLLKWYYDLEDKEERSTIPIVMGFVERGLFTAVIAVSPAAAFPSVIPAMAGWLGLKLAAGWNHGTQKTSPIAGGGNPEVIPANESLSAGQIQKRAMLSLIIGAVSLAFAYAGGLICLIPAS